MAAVSNTYGPVLPCLVSDGPEMQGPSGGGGGRWGRLRGEGATPEEVWPHRGRGSAVSISRMGCPARPRLKLLPFFRFGSGALNSLQATMALSLEDL